jgi:hypothetical protein
MRGQTTRLAAPALRRTRLLAAGLLGAVALGGCAVSEGHYLPSLRTDSPSPVPVLVARAGEFYDCLTAANVPVELTRVNGEPTLVRFAADHTVVYRNPDGTGASMIAARASAAERQAAEEFARANPSGPALLVDGVDHSQAYAACLDGSGYSAQEGYGTSQWDLARVTLQVTSNNQWAACARNYGWPTIRDSALPQTLDGTQWPTILLPPTMTDGQLEQLLAACPNFDPDRADQLQAWQRRHGADSWPPDYQPDPWIDIDLAQLNDPSPQTMAKVNQLSDLLVRQQREYWRARQTDSAEPVG